MSQYAQPTYFTYKPLVGDAELLKLKRLVHTWRMVSAVFFAVIYYTKQKINSCSEEMKNKFNQSLTQFSFSYALKPMRPTNDFIQTPVVDNI